MEIHFCFLFACFVLWVNYVNGCFHMSNDNLPVKTTTQVLGCHCTSIPEDDPLLFFVNSSLVDFLWPCEQLVFFQLTLAAGQQLKIMPLHSLSIVISNDFTFLYDFSYQMRQTFISDLALKMLCFLQLQRAPKYRLNDKLYITPVKTLVYMFNLQGFCFCRRHSYLIEWKFNSY